MTDIFSKKKRSQIMSNIKATGTKLENDFCKLLSKELYSKGYRYRRNYRKLPGCPDIVFIKYKIAIFLDGDFWHGYKFKERKRRLSKKYWIEKIESNIKRDIRNRSKLRWKGWKVLHFWEHQIKSNPGEAVKKIIKLL